MRFWYFPSVSYQPHLPTTIQNRINRKKANFWAVFDFQSLAQAQQVYLEKLRSLTFKINGVPFFEIVPDRGSPPLYPLIELPPAPGYPNPGAEGILVGPPQL